MNLNFCENLKILSENLERPLYAVGGIVRNFLINGESSTDIDLSGGIPTEKFLEMAKAIGFTICAEYPRTGTVVIGIDGERFEYTQFRKETYELGGKHTPTAVEFTDDIVLDAKRRDFKCNAVYYDIKNDKIVDPLGGVEDIKNRVLDTVVSPDEVFSHDGLRLMRLARFSGELNFSPTDDVLSSAKNNANNIKDISPERIYEELKRILVCDKKYSFSDCRGHYNALKILDRIRVLDKIMPELTAGRGMKQRADFHNYDVLEHSLKAVLYAEPQVRLSALLHDVGKPYSMNKFKKFHTHNIDGKPIARDILNRLKVDNETKEQVLFMVTEHMKDLDLKMGENKVRKYIVKNYHRIGELFMIKQADFSACKDDTSECPTIKKWKDIIIKMKSEGAPLTKKELAVTATDLMGVGLKGKEIGETLNELHMHAVVNPQDNEREKLLRLAKNRV